MANDAQAMLEQLEAECRRLDSQGWILVLNLNIRSTMALASTLALALRTPQNAGPCGNIDRALLEFIVNHLAASPLLQGYARQILETA